MNGRGVALFHTSAAVFRAETLLAREGFRVKLVPTPREFSSDCGVALQFDWGEAERVRLRLAEAGVEVAGVHEIG